MKIKESQREQIQILTRKAFEEYAKITDVAVLMQMCAELHTFIILSGKQPAFIKFRKEVGYD